MGVSPRFPFRDDVRDPGDARELPCVECGYDLRGQPPDGHCPECDAAVERALAGDALRVSSRGWLIALHNGLRLLSLSFATLVFVCPALALTLYVRPWNQPAERLWAALTIGATLGAVIAAFVGLILVTRRDPRDQNRAPGWDARRRTRAATILIAVLVALLALGMGPFGLTWLSARPYRFGTSLLFAILLAMLGAWFAHHALVLLGRASSGDSAWARATRFMILATAAVGIGGGVALMLEITTGWGGAVAGISLMQLPLLIWIDLMILWGLAGRTRDAVNRAVQGLPAR